MICLQRSSLEPQLQSRLSGFCQQLQTMGKRLHTLTVKQRDHNSALSSQEDEEDNKRRSAVETLVEEIEALRKKLSSGDQVIKDYFLEKESVSKESA